MAVITADRRRSLAGVIAAMAVVNLVYGITFPLLALVLDAQGIGKTLIGLNTVCQAAAIFAIAPLAPRLLSRREPARVMQSCAAGLAALFVLAGWFPNVWFWFPLRFLIGAMTALLWIASEALINELSSEAKRGRVVGIYAAVGSAGFALGPLLLIATGSVGMLPFYATAGAVLLAALPLVLVKPVRAGVDPEPGPGVWNVFRLAPVIMLANIVYAAAAESMITFFPLFGLHLGLGQEFALGLMTVIAVGSMVLVIPLGWLADHVHRMGMLAACVAVTVAGLLVMPYMVQAAAWIAVGFAFLFGGVEGMIYALGVILVGERFKGAALAAASTAFTACWGAGTIGGPLLAGIGMDLFGDGSLPWLAALFFAVYLPVPLAAWWRTKSAGNGRQARRKQASRSG